MPAACREPDLPREGYPPPATCGLSGVRGVSLYHPIYTEPTQG
nr:MAG TPA: hypothetical protein [Caudoviricetes sp.]